MDEKTQPFSWKRAEAHERVLISDVLDACAQGKRRRADHCTRLYLRSFASRLVATRAAANSLKGHQRPPKDGWPQIAAQLDAWAGTPEEVTVHFKPKASDPNAFRPIMDFGIENRALQQLVGSALKARANIHPNQFCVRGGGIHAAVAKVSTALMSGYCWVVETDIANCYSSFDGEEVPGLLPLPEEVTRKIILSRDLNLSPGNIEKWFGPADGVGGNDDALTQAIAEARRGIPQGSAVSPLVAEVLLAPVFTQLPKGGVVVAYADNILVMAQGENEAVSICKALWSALKSHPAGPLRPKEPRFYEPGKMVEFLGHTLTVKHDNCRIEPSQSNFLDFKAKFNKGLDRVLSATTQHRRQRLTNDLSRYVRSWSAAFALWKGASLHRKLHIEQIKAAAVGTKVQ